MGKITITQAIDGYLLAAHARRLSPNTIHSYQAYFDKFLTFLNADPPIEEIDPKQVEAFFASQTTVSKKSLLNYHIGLSALWIWCVEEGLVKEHVLHKVRRPKPEKKDVQPYTQKQVKDMLKALGHTKVYSRPGKVASNHSLPDAERNRAMIYLLIDTGIRADELCSLKIYQVDLKNRRITVMGKGSKQRMVPFSNRTGQILWRYLSTRKNDLAADFMFVTKEGRSLDRGQLLKIMTRIGNRAGIIGMNVHRFRHTFAINYLRNGGDAYTLQMMLGHSSMDMVRHYLALAQADLDKQHQLASPVENWRL
jgi:integrase/recombinase XerD